MKLELEKAGTSDIKLLEKADITTAQGLLEYEPHDLVMVLAKMSVEHNISDWIPAKNIVEIWINQARNIYDKGALLFPGLGGEAGGGGPK